MKCHERPPERCLANDSPSFPRVETGKMSASIPRESEGVRNDRGTELLAVGVVFLCALVVRLIAIGQESFFIDEAITRASLGRTWRHVVEVESSPPLYFFLIRAWASVFGSGHVALRLFSAVTGSLAPALVYLTLRLLDVRRSTAVAAGMLLILSPLSVYHSQQARHYALLSLLVALYFYLLVRVVVRGASVGRLVAVVGALLAGFSCHYFFVFVPIGFGLLLLGFGLLDFRNGMIRALFVAHVAAALLCLAYLPLVQFQMSFKHTHYIPRPVGGDLLSVYRAVFPAGPFGIIPGWYSRLFDIFYLGLVAAIMIFLRTGMAGSSQSNRLFSRGGWMATFFVSLLLSVALPFFLSLHASPIFIKDRYTIIALPPLALTLGMVIEGFAHRRPRRVALFLALALWLPIGLVNLYRYWTTYQEFDWRGGISIVEGQP